MNDHNLDDLIIGDPEPGGGKSRSLLSLVALVLIILIVGVLLTKLIFSGPEELDDGKTTELTGLVKPAPSTRAPQSKAQPAEPIPDELKPITRENLPESDELKPIVPRRQTPQTSAKPVAKKPAPRRQAPKTVTPKPKPKPQIKTKTKPAKLFEKRPKTSPQTETVKRSYYIQLGSFKRMPDQKFLDKIKAAGYKPLIIKTGNMIKVRIGTYNSYGEAKAKLPVIKEQLGIAGFVVRKK